MAARDAVDKRKLAPNDDLGVGLNRDGNNRVTRPTSCVEKRRVERTVRIEPGEKPAREGVDSLEVTTDKDLAVRLHGEGSRLGRAAIASRPAEVGHEGKVQRTVGIEASQAGPRGAVDPGESAADENLPVGLDEDGGDPVLVRGHAVGKGKVHRTVRV